MRNSGTTQAVRLVVLSVFLATLTFVDTSERSANAYAEPKIARFAPMEYQRDFRAIYGLPSDDSYLDGLQREAEELGLSEPYDPMDADVSEGSGLVLAPGDLPMTVAEYELVFAVMDDVSILHAVMPAFLDDPTFAGSWLDEANQTLTIATTSGQMPTAAKPGDFRALSVDVKRASMSVMAARQLADSIAVESSHGSLTADAVFSFSYDPFADIVNVSVDKLSDVTALAVKDLIAAVATSFHLPAVNVNVEFSERPGAAAANDSINPRWYGGARVFSATGTFCTQSFHVNKVSTTYGVFAAHCSFFAPGVWHGGVGGDFGGTGPWNPNEVWSKSSWTKYYNQWCTTPHQTWTNTGKTTGWAWSDVAFLDYWAPTNFQGRVYDPTHGYIRVRETVIPSQNESVMTYGATSNPSTQRIVPVTAVHVSLDLDMPKSGTYYPGGDQCLRTRISDMFTTGGAIPQLINGDSGGPVTKTVWRTINGQTVAVALPVGVISARNAANTAWHSYMWNVNSALGVAPLQGA